MPGIIKYMDKPRQRRHRLPTAKPGEIRIAYGDDNSGFGKGLVYVYGAYGAYKGHTYPLMQAFEKLDVGGGLTLKQYLEREGFDITTLKLSVRRHEALARDGSPPPAAV